MIQTFTSACCRLMLRLCPVGKSGCKLERQNASVKVIIKDHDYVHYKNIGGSAVTHKFSHHDFQYSERHKIIN